MLNKQQLQFRKAMAEREKDLANRRTHDVYSYRYNRFESEKPRRLYRKQTFQLGGAIGLLILLWNIFAMSTWILPQLSNPITMNSQSSVTTRSNEVIHTYLKRTEVTDTTVNAQINALMNLYNQNLITHEEINQSYQQLLLAQTQTATTDSRLQPLKTYYDETFNIVYQILDVLRLPYDETKNNRLTHLISQLTQTRAERQLKVIMIFQTEDIEYQLKADGSISYKY